MRLVIGLLLAFSPLIVLFAACVVVEGWLTALAIFGVVAIIAGVVALGAHLVATS